MERDESLEPGRLRRLQLAIDAALKLAVERDGFMVGEGQELAQKHPGDALVRIQPVIGVENSAPGDAAGAAAVGPRQRVDHVPKTPFARNSGKQVQIVCELRVRRLPQAGT